MVPARRAAGSPFVELVRLSVVVAFTALGDRAGRQVAHDPASTRIILGAILGAGVGYVLGGALGRAIERSIGGLERKMTEVSGADVVAGGIGTIAALVGASLVLWPVLFVPMRSVTLPSLGFCLLVIGFTGYRFGIAKREDLLQLFGLSWRTRATDLKVLDTSAILDVRLLDAVRSGFIRGPILVPGFVLEEVQSIADAGDPVRRSRGRRGLETLTALRHERIAELRVVTDRTFPEYAEVDAKVIALARERGGAIVTNDTALGRIAELQGIEVLSLNALAEAMRPPVLPGETLTVHVQKEGREPMQGVGYLDDGTMVVVEGGRPRMGQTIDVSVTSILQTSGGRMIFSRPVPVVPESAAQ
jgi:uncharacterized protein YacL